MSEPVRKLEESYTYADLLTWPEDQRCELIDGMLYNMTPAPGLNHQEIVGELHVQFHNYLRQHRPCRVKMDRQQKKHIYAQAGVREYWIVSPSEKTVEVYQLQEQRRYGEATVYQYNEQVPVGMLPGLVIDLTQVFIEEEETKSNE